MRRSELWARLDRHLGATYSRTWAAMTALRELDGRTVSEALDQGEPALSVWRAVHTALELSARDR